jgi:hypothetical protein
VKGEGEMGDLPWDGIEEQGVVIFRCGWCGLPVNEDGSYIEGISTIQDINDYFEKHSGCEEHHVNGECCPNGDGTENYVIVTREMAIDAECPEMEGQRIKWG